LKIAVFIGHLGLGGTEKAAVLWVKYLAKMAGVEEIKIASLEDGPRRKGLQELGFDVRTGNSRVLQDTIAWADVVHSHFLDVPATSSFLTNAIQKTGRKIPVVETNVFGRFSLLPSEQTEVSHRLFISWVSCVQAARRSGLSLDSSFFRRQSVAVYPVEPRSENELISLKQNAQAWRNAVGLKPDHILFGRFSRPEPNKWEPMILKAFFRAHCKNQSIRLLLREPPPAIAADLTRQKLAAGFGAAASQNPVLLLPATVDSGELAVSQSACDVILHTSSIGESFGYGIAEPMALGKPVITHSVPWHDQAQLELVQPGKSGLVASVHSALTRAIIHLADDSALRESLGQAAKNHVLELSNPRISAHKIMTALRCALENRDNPDQLTDAERALKTARYLDLTQWGTPLRERLYLGAKSAWIEVLRRQRKLRDHWKSTQAPA
jgi:hypothetical protein